MARASTSRLMAFRMANLRDNYRVAIERFCVLIIGVLVIWLFIRFCMHLHLG
jgi:hypothetical protein